MHPYTRGQENRNARAWYLRDKVVYSFIVKIVVRLKLTAKNVRENMTKTYDSNINAIIATPTALGWGLLSLNVCLRLNNLDEGKFLAGGQYADET